MLDLVSDTFTKGIKEEDLSCLNNILTNEKLDDLDRKNAFSIAIFFTNRFGPDTLKKFTDFCLNDQNIDKLFFPILLRDINIEVQRLINLDNDTYDEFNLFENKILTILEVSEHISELNDKKYFEILDQILMSRLSWNNYRFIKELFANEIMKENPKKRDIAFEIALNDKVTIMTNVNDCHFYPIVWSVLTNYNVLSFNDKTYKKVVKIAIEHMKSYLLNVVIKREDLTASKKAFVVDYYVNILKKCYPDIYQMSMDWILEVSKSTVFSVVYCDRLVSMNDREYRKELRKIMQCNNPFSYTKIFEDENISDEQREVALKIIEQGDFSKERVRIVNDMFDYKVSVCDIALSPLLLSFSLEEYEKFLLLQNSYCEKANSLLWDSDKHTEWCLVASIRNAIRNLLINDTIFYENIPRLLKAVNAVISIDDDNLIFEVARFCSHNNSAYYTDEEYDIILDIIKNNVKDFKYISIVGLFINENVPYMMDKSCLFDMAINGDKESIKKYTEELNKQGYFNINMNYILNGVDRETINMFSITEDVNVKKLVVL